MANVTLMDQPKDYKRLGITDGSVEPWEDTLRTDPNGGVE